jgi:hypothetical protein
MLCLNLSYLREYQTRESSMIYCRIIFPQKTAGWFVGCLLPLRRQIRLPIHFRIARRRPHLPHGLSIIDGGGHGVGFLRLFSRDQGGQDRLREKSDSLRIPVISFKIAVCADGLFHLFRALHSAQWLLRHASNLAKDFEHEVQRNRASRTQINPGA